MLLEDQQKFRHGTEKYRGLQERKSSRRMKMVTVYTLIKNLIRVSGPEKDFLFRVAGHGLLD